MTGMTRNSNIGTDSDISCRQTSLFVPRDHAHNKHGGRKWDWYMCDWTCRGDPVRALAGSNLATPVSRQDCRLTVLESDRKRWGGHVTRHGACALVEQSGRVDVACRQSDVCPPSLTSRFLQHTNQTHRDTYTELVEHSSTTIQTTFTFTRCTSYKSCQKIYKKTAKCLGIIKCGI